MSYFPWAPSAWLEWRVAHCRAIGYSDSFCKLIYLRKPRSSIKSGGGEQVENNGVFDILNSMVLIS